MPLHSAEHLELLLKEVLFKERVPAHHQIRLYLLWLSNPFWEPLIRKSLVSVHDGCFAEQIRKARNYCIAVLLRPHKISTFLSLMRLDRSRISGSALPMKARTGPNNALTWLYPAQSRLGHFLKVAVPCLRIALPSTSHACKSVIHIQPNRPRCSKKQTVVASKSDGYPPAGLLP